MPLDRPVRIIAAALVAVSLAACTAQGPRRLEGERFNYNAAIAATGKQQMLANIVRFRYLDFPVFMAVGSVITSYSFEGGVGVGGTSGLSEALGGDVASVDANVAYAERPTITYTPLSGQAFTRRMLKPIPVEAIFALGQTGWDVELLLLTGINRINEIENLSFEVDPATDTAEKRERSRREIEQLQRFRRVVELFLTLVQQEAIELQSSESETGVTLLVFDDDVSEALRPDVDQFKTLLNLDEDRGVFRVTTRLTRRKPDEIAIHSRSLLAIMSFLSKGVDVPDVHLSNGWTESFPVPEIATDEVILPLRIRSRAERPENAFSAVRYQGYWFYVDQADLESKAVFQMLLALFELQAPAGGGAAPLLTLPAGG